MTTIHTWRSYPTHVIDYNIRSSEELRQIIPTPREPLRCPRPLLEVAIPDHDNVEFRLNFPCFSCSGCGSPDQYLQTCEQHLITNLRSRFPSVPVCCAAKVAKTFREIVKCAHASHRCPRPSLLHCIVSFATIIHVVHIQMRPLSHVRALVDIDRAIDESFQEAAAGASFSLRPATKDSVRELFKVRNDRHDEAFKFKSHECVICFEEMETPKTALTMPCSHTFHQACLLRWLDTNHVCPPCRYELPAAATQD